MAAPSGRLARFIPSKFVEKISYIPGKINVSFPERLKGTVVEKWAKYWQNLLTDYKEVGKDTLKDIRTKPLKSACIGTGIAAVSYCVTTNPDETSFRDYVLSMVDEMVMVPAAIRNPKASDHLIFLELCYNQGIVRRLSIGVASFMWIDNYDKSLGLYAAQCNYLKPSYLTFHERFIDIGFLGRWWIMDKAMQDFDINPTEWKTLNEEREPTS